MNPVAVFLLVLAVGFAVGAVILPPTTGPYNVFWLLGLGSVLASLAIQTTGAREDRPVSAHYRKEQ